MSQQHINADYPFIIRKVVHGLSIPGNNCFVTYQSAAGNVSANGICFAHTLDGLIDKVLNCALSGNRNIRISDSEGRELTFL
jgi:hypothetical protein